MDLIDDLYDAKFPFTINLPLDIASADATTKDQATHVDGIDLSMLTKGIRPSHALKQRLQSEKGKIWTFETILSDLEVDFNRNKNKTQSNKK